MKFIVNRCIQSARLVKNANAHCTPVNHLHFHNSCDRGNLRPNLTSMESSRINRFEQAFLLYSSYIHSNNLNWGFKLTGQVQSVYKTIWLNKQN